MKQKNKLSYTFLILVFTTIIYMMFNCCYVITYPELIVYKGGNGVLSLTIILSTYFLINIWKISKEEKLIKAGKKEEVNKVKKLFSEGILNQLEVEEKFEILLNKVIEEKRIEKKYLNKLKKEELTEKLIQLRDKKVITKAEFNNKLDIISKKFN